MRRIVFGMLFALLLVGTLALAFNVGLVRAQAETVTINSDGSVSPSSAPISSVDNVTYTFTGNMAYPTYNGIVVERGNIVINGNDCTVQGVNDQSIGLNVTDMSDVTIKNINIKDFYFGIYLDSSSNNFVGWNNVTANGNVGICLDSSSNNTVNGNDATLNGLYGIWLESSSSNIVSDNNATGSSLYGIYLDSSSNNNTVSGNNATANGDGIWLESSSNNTVSGNNATANFNNIAMIGSSGIALFDGSSNNIVSGNNATENSLGIQLSSSSNNTVSGNNATANAGGIDIEGSSNNTVNGNDATANNVGIDMLYSSNNTVSGNNASANSYCGIILQGSSSNTIYHNNFVGNGAQASVDSASVGNIWDNGYPSGGNYWSDYNGTDLYRGVYQNVTGSDGIGDVPYVIDANNTDDYPLMGMFSTFNVAGGVDVQVVSNSTVYDFQFNGTAILFNVSGANGTTGFCNICVPTALLNGTLSIFINGTQVQYSLLPSSNSTQTYLYFTCGHSTEQVTIMPEFPDSLVLAMFMLATLLPIAIYKKRHNRSIHGKA